MNPQRCGRKRMRNQLDVCSQMEQIVAQILRGLGEDAQPRVVRLVTEELRNRLHKWLIKALEIQKNDGIESPSATLTLVHVRAGLEKLHEQDALDSLQLFLCQRRTARRLRRPFYVCQELFVDGWKAPEKLNERRRARAYRLDKLTEQFSAAEYLQFSDARRVGLLDKGQTILLCWLKVPHLSVQANTLEAVAWLGKEIVAVAVDSALAAREITWPSKALHMQIQLSCDELRKSFSQNR